ncbi:VOC family protein [Longirhabdus pacifica]|uniref:VOC family protein n=1 Tax=Longirhabdus pacifica TaxID=2305227 RepID=UPI0010092F91|nr:VOC family protein [Longirhabdus pacifica]
MAQQPELRVDSCYIVARDMTKLVDFYTNTLGFDLIFQNEFVARLKFGSDPFTGTTALTIMNKKKIRGGPSPMLGINTTEIQDTFNDLKAKNADIITDITDYTNPEMTPHFELRDPEKNVITVVACPEQPDQS